MQKAGLTVFGVSADTAAAQKKFQEKYELPYHLLADTDKKVAEAFGVIKEKNMYGRKVMGIARTTFLIDGGGTIAKVFENVKPDGHAEQVLTAFKK
jgi:peroxiredoxin Q/BCP